MMHLKDIIESNLLAAKTAIFEGQYTKAQMYYELAVLADTTAFENLHTLCKYLFSQEQSKTLLTYAYMMQTAAKSEEEKSTAWQFIGHAHFRQNQQSKALPAYQEALKARKTLVQENPSNEFKASLANTLAIAW